MQAAGNVNIGIMLIQRSSSLYLLTLCLELMLPYLIFLVVAKEKKIGWLFGRMSRSKESILEFILDFVSRKI